MTAAVPAKPSPHPSADSAPFWAAAADGRLLLQCCEDCGEWQHYPRALCASCWGNALAWSELGGSGSVWTFTVAHRPAHPAWSADVPYAIAVVELDEGPRLLANIVGCPPGEVAVGMRVHVTFERRAGYAAVQFSNSTRGEA